MAYDIKRWKNMPSMACITITPEMAQDMLDRNHSKNRQLVKTVVAAYSEDMKKGYWRAVKSQPIVFTKDGILLDGQHRLHAIIRAGISVPMWVLCDAKIEDFEYIDNGKPRSVTQFVDVPSKNNVCALAGYVVCIQYGSPLRSSLEGKISNVTIDQNSKGKATRAMIKDCVDKNKDELLECIRSAEKIRLYCGYGSIKEISSFIWTMKYLEKDAMLEEFVNSFSVAENGHQANLYRTWLVKMYGSRLTPKRGEIFKRLLESYDDFCSNKKKIRFVNCEKLFEAYGELVAEKYNNEHSSEVTA